MTSPVPGPPGGQSGRKLLTQRELFLLAFAGAVVTANAYYIHPIISLVAKDFGVSPSEIGLVPALNQIALAAGIFFLLPLGDRFGNRELATLFAAAQLAGLCVMAFASSFWMFVAGSTFLGFSTITPPAAGLCLEACCAAEAWSGNRYTYDWCDCGHPRRTGRGRVDR